MPKKTIANFNITHYKNDSAVLDITVYDIDTPGNTPLDLTPYTLTYSLIHKDGIGVDYIATIGNGITVVDAANGNLQVSIPPDTLTHSGRWDHILRIYESGVYKQTALLGGFNVKDTID